EFRDDWIDFTIIPQFRFKSYRDSMRGFMDGSESDRFKRS
ncbi:unnamed protein product, partial [marine sediment metagenome]